MEEIDIHDVSLSKKSKKEILLSHLHGNTCEVRFKYASSFSNTKTLRDYVEALSDILDFQGIWKSRIILVSDELNNNAIEYGSSSEAYNYMSIFFFRDGDHCVLRIEVEDMGNGESHKKASEMEKLHKEHIHHNFYKHNSIRGRGLFMIVRNLVDTLYFKDSENGGLIVGVEKTFPLV